jgi:formyltetrahydrofolate synthetase
MCNNAVVTLMRITNGCNLAVRALKMHGGGPPVTAGQPLDETYRTENVELLTAGCCNLARHIRNSAAYGVPVVVAINRFATDTDAELSALKQAALDAGNVVRKPAGLK